MSSQGVTRKRPAPGTIPANHSPQSGLVSNYPPANPGSQLSNDQFLQWGQNPPVNAINTSTFADPSTYNPASFAASHELSAPATPAAPAATQLARRQAQNQLVTRNRGYEQAPGLYPENASVGGGESGAWAESLDELYQRALAAKREAQSKRKQIPPFVQKLSSFLDESKNTELIRWSDDGNSFIVLDEDEFARTLIPELFKHNNYASFVRQLNMYGFHKKVGLSDNSMRASERKNKSPSEYANPYFKRGHSDLLWLIQKPKNTAGHGSKGSKGGARVKTEEDENELEEYGEDGAPIPRDDRARPRQLSLLTDSSMPNDQLAGVYGELQAIRQQQSIISSTINRLRKEHEQLYAQAANFQEQHTRHENSINAILTFLATVYNRSLQGQDGNPNLANSFAGAISGDQGNIVDVGDDFSLGPLAAMNSPAGQRTMKKQPLLLKAPPAAGENIRATTLSPSTGGNYETRSRSHARQPSATQPGHVEEVLDNSPRRESSSVPSGPSGLPPHENFPERDIMSVIQNSNARNGVPTSFSEFPNVLSSLETSGGNVPLTPNQRADMLRLMANETNTADTTQGTSNNALITPNPPPMPQNYSGRLANTRQEIDNLVKMQAEQDRSVQNLTNLLQPLSPTGTIPGLDSDGNVPPPPLDLDSIFNNDYFTDLGGDADNDKKHFDLEDNAGQAAGAGTNRHEPAGQADEGDTNELFNFDHIPDNGDLFDGSNQGQGQYNYNFDGANYSGDVDSKHKVDSGRVIEQLTDSESTSPAATTEDNSGQPEDGGSAKRRRRA